MFHALDRTGPLCPQRIIAICGMHLIVLLSVYKDCCNYIELLSFLLVFFPPAMKVHHRLEGFSDGIAETFAKKNLVRLFNIIHSLFHKWHLRVYICFWFLLMFALLFVFCFMDIVPCIFRSCW